MSPTSPIHTTEHENTIAAHLLDRIDAMNERGKSLLNISTIHPENLRRDLVLVGVKPSGGVNILVCDFLGHGLSMTLVALPVATLFHELTQQGLELYEIIDAINETLLELLPDALSYPACLIEIEKQGRRVGVWNAGLQDIALVDLTNSKICHRIEPLRHTLGDKALSDAISEIKYIEVSANNKLFAHTFYQRRQSDIQAQQADLNASDIETLIEQTPLSEKVISSLVTSLKNTPQALGELTVVEIDLEQVISLSQAFNLPTEKDNKPASTWRVSFDLEADTLRTTDIAMLVVNAVMDIQGLRSHQQRLYTIIAELANNAVEHGILKLDSSLKETPTGFSEYYKLRSQNLAKLIEGKLNVELTHQKRERGGELTIRFEDTGEGFNYSDETNPSVNPLAPHGRGETLLRQLCSSVQREGRGNITQAVYQWV